MEKLDFFSKYTSEIEKLKDENKDKIALSNDAFALAEIIDNLIKKIEHLRVSAIMK